MKRKKELIVVLTSLLVIVLSVSVAYFTTKILGTGKEISVESADLKVIFTSGSGTINGTNIEPGWSSGENTFTVKNESNGTYKYNIIIKDLVNTFTTSGFLVYKITSADGGYNMADFVDVPKSSTATDTVLAENISLEKGATHTYKIIINYNNSDDVDQSADMGKILSGKIFIEKYAESEFSGYLAGSLGEKILNNNPTIDTRVNFDTAIYSNTANTLYKATENGTDVYYFAGIDNNQGSYCAYDHYFSSEIFTSLSDEVIYVNSVEDYNNFVENDSEDAHIFSKERCNQNSLCYSGQSYIVGLSQNDCNEIGGDFLDDSYGDLIWVTGNEINNWVKFGKYKSDLIKYRGFINPTATTSFIEYSTMEECTSASKYNYNCTAYKYASAGDDMYWRIIRTNPDGSIRLLYSGTSPDTTEGHIGTSAFNTNENSPKYVGYMYGDSDTTPEEARTNTNDSTIKTYIDNWYANNMTSYTKYLSTTAVYCNDRELASGDTYSTSSSFHFKSNERLVDNIAPSYNCTNSKDAFSVNNEEAKLTYPIALMTADEISYAGGVYGETALMWYYTNSTHQNILESYWLSLLSPLSYYNDKSFIFSFDSSFASITLVEVSYSSAVRPVTSLKSCVQWKSGNGSAESPYEIVENGGC